MRRTAIWLGVLVFACAASARGAQLYGSDFEGVGEGALPKGWEVGFNGKGKGSIIRDPLDNANRVFASTDQAHDAARHDVGGVVYVVGDPGWKDYIIEYDAYFPADFYMGVLFRWQEENKFYLFDRRSGGESGNFDFWYRSGGAWNGVQRAGKFQADPKVWHRFRLEIQGDRFTAYAALRQGDVKLAGTKPILEGTNGDLKTGKFGLYGLIYIDNLVIGETESDLALSVEPRGKLTATWAALKR